MPTAPYPNLQDILNTARVRLNDSIKTPVGAPAGQIGGQVLSDTALFSQQTTNAAWQRMQEFLVSKMFSRLVNTVIISNITAVATTDPAVFCSIDWAGYFNGSVTAGSPVLPQDLSTPLRLKERVSGSSNVAAEFTPMEYVSNGIFGGVKSDRNFNWTWDSDKIKFPGANRTMDFELRYASFIAGFQDTTGPTVPWYQQPVPIMRCEDALSWYIVAEVGSSRGDIDGPAVEAKAEAAATKLVEKEQQIDQLRQQWVIPAIPQATGATPYDTVQTVLNTVKTRLNVLNANAADILITNQPYMQQIFNTAWRRFQAFLADKGYIRMTKEVIISNLAPKTDQDPAVQVSLDWNGYDNGTVFDPTIQLPMDLILPMYIWERQTGMNAIFIDMTQWLDGLQNWPQFGLNRVWEWRGDAIFMPGTNFPTDLRIRYAAYLADFVEGSPSAGPWYSLQVPIVRALDSLASYVCAEIAVSIPGLELDADAFRAAGEDSAKVIFNRDARQKQRVNVRRMSRSGRLEGNRGSGWDGPSGW